MSSVPPPGPNPYDSPNLPTGAAGTPVMPGGPLPTSMEYFRTVNYVFENPNWFMNLLWLFLAQIVAMCIPIVPQIVVMGYQFETIDGLLQTRGTRYPDFRLDRFGDYLMRGLWPMLAMLVVSIGALVAVGLPALCCGGGIATLGNLKDDDAGAAISLVFIPTMGIMSVVLFFVLTPIGIRAGMAQDFAAAFDFAWVKNFVGKMWLDMLLSVIILSLVAWAAIVCTCFIGMLVVIPIAPLVYAHLWYQFYAIYLARGGTPVPARMSAFASSPPMQPPAI